MRITMSSQYPPIHPRILRCLFSVANMQPPFSAQPFMRKGASLSCPACRIKRIASHGTPAPTNVRIADSVVCEEHLSGSSPASPGCSSQVKACFALRPLHHLEYAFCACDGHHGRGLWRQHKHRRANRGFLALQFHEDLTRIEQGFGAFQRIS